MARKQATTVELSSLVGEHLLTGVDLSNAKVKHSYGKGYDDCTCLSFTLDGVTYTAIEDPDDGYRSSCRDIAVSDTPLTNTFPAVPVVARMFVEAEDYRQYVENDVLEVVSTATGLVILEVGTADCTDYYPSFVCTFSPQNI